MRYKALQLWLAGVLVFCALYVWPGVMRYEYRRVSGRGVDSRYDHLTGVVQYRQNGHWER